MRAFCCQSAWWSVPVKLLTCVYWTRPAPRNPGRTSRLPCLFFFSTFLPCFLFHFVFVFFHHSLCLSCAFSPFQRFFYFFYFFKSAPFPPQLFSLPSCTVLFSRLSSLLLLFYYSFLAALPPVRLSVFILYYFGTSLSAFRFVAMPSPWRPGFHLFSSPG